MSYLVCSFYLPVKNAQSVINGEGNTFFLNINGLSLQCAFLYSNWQRYISDFNHKTEGDYQCLAYICPSILDIIWSVKSTATAKGSSPSVCIDVDMAEVQSPVIPYDLTLTDCENNREVLCEIMTNGIGSIASSWLSAS